VQRVPAMVRETIEQQPLTRFDRSHFMLFAESGLRVETVYWVLDPDYNKYADIQHTINVELMRRLTAENIEFALPSRTVYVRSPEQGLAAVAAGAPS
jgi:small-conductance mechanosensitive channel